jgi:uncharacterized DUF497 family protein
MEFEWDQNKNLSNIAKHGYSFNAGARIFAGYVLEYTDIRRDYGEIRVTAIGVVDAIELTVIYTMRGEVRRIISVRRSNRRERRTYREIYTGESS